jgi:hypothetical protein
MSWVEVYWDPSQFIKEEIRVVIKALPQAVAKAFDVPSDPDGRLTEDAIEIKNQRFDDLDIHSKPLAIIIRTEDYPARRKNLKDRLTAVKNDIEMVLPPHVRGMDACSFFWVRPVPGVYIEF